MSFHTGTLQSGRHHAASQIETPASRRLLHAAGMRARAVAIAVDFAINLAVCPATLGLSAVVLRSLWPLGAAAVAALYFWLLWSEGQTCGMRVAGIRLVRLRDGRAPGFRAAAARVSLALPPAIAMVVLLNAALDPTFSSAALGVLAAVVLMGGIADNAWGLWDPAGLPLHDRATGLATVRVAHLEDLLEHDAREPVRSHQRRLSHVRGLEFLTRTVSHPR
jgi:uncharacterized RDD family membrane protein YckC